ncbi:MAG: ATP-dependent DNA helicase RecG [Clostridiaceae bacterium]|nr:ATP-dependent DNA helicase RecG [Clostridiaceae bacterium]
MKPFEKGSVDDPITVLRGVGETTAALFERLGVVTVGDLLRHFPRSFEDRTAYADIASLEDGQSACVRATVTSAPTLVRGKNRPFVRAVVSDDTGVMTLMIFNAPYAKNRLATGEMYVFYGKAQRSGRHVTMINPVIDHDDARPSAEKPSGQTGSFVPVYPLTAGLSQPTVRKYMRQALAYADRAPELLPESIREHYELVPYADALRGIHAPEDARALERAQTRLAFEELFLLAMVLSRRRIRASASHGAKLGDCDMEPFYHALPYALTGAQKRVIAETMADMTREGEAMHRLIQGDVGSGKTAVAAACAYAAAQSGWQTALMVPTEILAEQHFHSLSALLEPLGVHVDLLTGSVSAPTRRAVLSSLASGMTRLIIGTHVLLTEGVVYQNLRLVITDEQHRFGVAQRTRLTEKGAGDGCDPHVLVMSATPIPRTLALVLYGDLDISALDELPPGRTPIQTRVLSEKTRMKAYGFMQTLFAEGRQGYVVCPHIEDNEEDDILSVEEHVKTLSEIFPDYKVACLHGRMKPAEKERVMRAFAAGEITLLVSTTVIEVGVNVPNATIMVIENAERFGLAQLHQLRGRVGRGEHPSYCILFSGNANEETRARLSALSATNDGFALAQEDLRLRGPGDFIGIRQSGVPGLHMVFGGTDLTMFADAQDAVQMINISDPDLDGYPELHVYVDTVIRKAAQTS